MIRNSLKVLFIVSCVLVICVFFVALGSIDNNAVLLFVGTMYSMYVANAVRDSTITVSHYDWTLRHLIIWLGRDWPIQIAYLALYKMGYLGLTFMLLTGVAHLASFYIFYHEVGNIVRWLLCNTSPRSRLWWWPLLLLAPFILYLLINII